MRKVSTDTKILSQLKNITIDTIYQECGGPNTRVNAVINKLKGFRRIGNPQILRKLEET